MSEQYTYKGYTIRWRELNTGGEWQVVDGRKILMRFDLEEQARKWVRQEIKKTA